MNKIAILWTSLDKDVALKVVFPYVYNSMAHGWWEHVQLIVWGPSQRLLSEDFEVKKWFPEFREAGVELTACRQCADEYMITNVLEELGIEVKYMGEPLTELIKSGCKVLTF